MEPNPPKFLTENWLRLNSHQNQESQPQNDDVEEEQEEALSLCDLATSKHDNPEATHPKEPFSDEDFDFSSAGTTLPESKMCSADELFFRGKILPFKHPVNLPFGFMNSFSGSEPASVVSSRSSSTRSNNSGTSGSSNTSGSEFTGSKPTIRNRNQFHSHPSPTPQIRTRSGRHSNPKTSSKWSFLQLGVMKAQEIGLEDLKNRSQRSHGSSMKDQDQKKKKMKISFLGGCTCTIENTVCSRIPMVKPTGLKEEETKSRVSKESNVGRSTKHAVSSHRTSEWLKQLSIQESASL
ncbi:hypothetical protein L2E82_43943 [Cichorium intybus]|uniref:Uncharacterized protein n=1 Tax=Cichorium intybus TaxID=13427 RepID=A0ACB8ZPL6_CICIN|nr:hypothetical protein L2E82_43943 [Cichorium intybus]